MEGYTTHDVLADEVKSIFPIFAICFLIIEVVSLIVAAALYQTALLQYILFSLPNIAVLLMVVLCGFGLSALLVCRQNSAEPHKGACSKERDLLYYHSCERCICWVYYFFLIHRY